MVLAKGQTMNGTELTAKKYIPHVYSQMIFDKGTKAIQCWKISFQQMISKQLDTYAWAKNTLCKPHSLLKKITSKWIIALNEKHRN